VLAVRVPPGGNRVRPGPEPLAPVPVAAVGLAAGHPAGRLLRAVLHRPRYLPGLPQGPGGVGTRGAGARHAGDLVGLDAGVAVLPGLVAAAPGLAGRGGAARRAGRLGPVVPAGDQDQVLLLRAGVRAVPDPGHRALPGPDPGTRHGQLTAPGDRRPHRGRLRAVRAAHVLVLLFDSGRKGHPVPGLAGSHVVPDRPRLDLAFRTGRVPRARADHPVLAVPPLSIRSGGLQVTFSSAGHPMFTPLADGHGEVALSDVIFATTGYVSGPVKRLYTVR